MLQFILVANKKLRERNFWKNVCKIIFPQNKSSVFIITFNFMQMQWKRLSCIGVINDICGG